MSDDQQTLFNQQLAARFAQLPKPVQDSILSADIQKKLRELATAHKLHVDQWDILENEVMLTILGLEKSENLEKNLIQEVGVGSEDAHGLAESINTIVFEPIRKELERQLEHPAAEEKQTTGTEAVREQLLGGEGGKETPQSQTPAAPPPTPPTPKPETTVVRAPSSGAYKAGEISTARASVVDDPYREPPQ